MPFLSCASNPVYSEFKMFLKLNKYIISSTKICKNCSCIGFDGRVLVAERLQGWLL